MSQLPLEFGHRPHLAAEDFLPAPCNSEALAWVQRWPDWPGPALALFGPAGCGKTHLVHLFAARAKAPIVPAAGLGIGDPPRLLETARAVAVEDADRGVDEVALFHLYNLARESGAHLLLTGREPPARWKIGLPDLRSRLNAAPAAGIEAPDDSLLAAVLVKLFADRQVKVSEEVPAYLLGRIERSFAAARAIVEALDKAALARKRPVTVHLAREILESL